eukprot:506726-Rhodomonas_salina.2
MLTLTLPARESLVCTGLGLHLGLTLAADQALVPEKTPGHVRDPQVVGGVVSASTAQTSGRISPAFWPGHCKVAGTYAAVPRVLCQHDLR